jgi:hypothetical protein
MIEQDHRMVKQRCYPMLGLKTFGNAEVTLIGRPPIDKEIRDLIRRISRENPLWGAPRIQSELHLLGFNVTERTVAKYRIKHDKPPSQTWRTFLTNHANQIAAVDFSRSRRSISAIYTVLSSFCTIGERSLTSM